MAGGFRFPVEVKGLERARGVAQRIKSLGGDVQPLLAIVGSILEASTRRRFDTGRGPSGVPWPPTRRQERTAVGASGPNKARILVDTGGLLGSIRHEVRQGEVEIGVDARTESARAAAAHQFGSHKSTVVRGHTRVITQAFGVPIPARTVNVRPFGRITNLPARPFIGVDDQDRRDVEDETIDYLRSLFPNA